MLLDAMTWACLLLTAGAGAGDAWHMNTGKFQIPIRIQASRRDEIKELQLYVSRDQGRTWDLVAKATPDKDNFPYYAPSDGTYWFSVAVVDQKGQQDPRDIMKAPVGQRIVVDTVKPDVRITASERRGDEIVVRWEARDENADFSTLKVEYRTADAAGGLWSQANATPSASGETTFRASANGPVMVRVTVQDQAGNIGQTQAEVASGPSTVPAPVATPLPRPVMTSAPAPVSSPMPVSTPVVSPAPAPVGPMTPMPVGGNWNTNTVSPAPLPARVADQLETPPGTSPVTATPVGNSAGRAPVVALSGSTAMTATSAEVTPPARPAPTPRNTLPGLQLVNKRLVRLDFEVAKFGSSGLGSVDVYVTTDDGQNWEKQPGDPTPVFPPAVDRSGPVKGSVAVQLLREGVIYGFCLVVKSRAGLGKAPPQRGDLPQIRVELDSTLPEAELYAPQADPMRRDTLLLTWKAADRNLAGNPITLEWAERRDGPWNPIGASELPNTGRHSWAVPPNVPASVFLRLTVRDTAGNTAVAQTNEPILVDLTVPEVGVITLGTSAR